ncbi:MAG TPA: hypothetical protein VG326_10915 [Tepidisphaeraceae bacterium]|jgi:hypothetical protein|nr:hypothetical protein [Tepidisphaeraceae bacterium]
MDGTIVLGRAECKQLAHVYCSDANPQFRLRAHLLGYRPSPKMLTVLLLSDGRSWAMIAACSSARRLPLPAGSTARIAMAWTASSVNAAVAWGNC